MVFKFVDADGRTHLMQRTDLTYLGSGRPGYDRALEYDGGANIVNYDSPGTESPDQRLFVVYPPGQPRTIVAVHARGAWLMNDKGDTIENLRALNEPRTRTAGVEVASTGVAGSLSP